MSKVRTRYSVLSGVSNNRYMKFAGETKMQIN